MSALATLAQLSTEPRPGSAPAAFDPVGINGGHVNAARHLDLFVHPGYPLLHTALPLPAGHVRLHACACRASPLSLALAPTATFS